jgi:hypothetical protein
VQGTALILAGEYILVRHRCLKGMYNLQEGENNQRYNLASAVGDSIETYISTMILGKKNMSD